MKKLTHIDNQGAAHMVDVSDKSITKRFAHASGNITLSSQAYALLLDNNVPKGDVFATARIAAINVAKQTSQWIPLCHVLPLESVKVDITMDNSIACIVRCDVKVTATAKTGVEMEALLGVQAALITIYDMLKAVDKSMVMSDIRLLEKRGGQRGDYIRG